MITHRLSKVALGSLVALVGFSLFGAGAAANTVPPTLAGQSDSALLIAQIALFPDRTLEWLLASFGAALFFFVPLLIYPAGMGMGDVKLAALIGAVLGWSVAVAILGALLAGAVFAVAVLVREGMSARKKAIPYGPFIAFGGIVVMLLGGR